MAHDPLDLVEQVHDELEQLDQSGYLVAEYAKRFGLLEPSDEAGAEALLSELECLPRRADWTYVEPDPLDQILETLQPVKPGRRPHQADLRDKILGGWLGRIAGCNVGKPVEDGFLWSRASLRSYLELADAYPLRDYVPALDPMPEGYSLRPDNWQNTTRGNVDGSARDDDIDYAILALHLLETYGRSFTPADVAHAWIHLFPYGQVYTAERVVYRNLIRGLAPSAAGGERNPYREWIGALIRADVFGYVNPGDPRAAAVLAYQDASLSHRANGIYGAMWAASLVAGAFTAGSLVELVQESLEHVPPNSRLHEAVRHVLDRHLEGASWEATLAESDVRWSGYSWVHTINNAAAIAAGLLWSDGDPAAAIGLTVQAGMDTDSNGATAGSVIGVLVGASHLPPQLIDPLHDRTRSALFGFDDSRISDLAERTAVLAEQHLIAQDTDLGEANHPHQK